MDKTHLKLFPIFKCILFDNLKTSSRSDSRAREKNSQKKNEGRLEGERGRELSMLSPPRFPLPRFPGVQLNSLPTYRRALLSERLEQAK